MALVEFHPWHSRDANWPMHLETFNSMLPHDKAFDHLKLHVLPMGKCLHNRYEDAHRGRPNSTQRIY